MFKLTRTNPAKVSEAQAERWDRMGNRVVLGYLAVVGFTGLCFVVDRLVALQWGMVFVGVISTAAGCSVGVVAWVILQMVLQAIEDAHEMEGLRYRIDMLEAAAEMREVESNADHDDHDGFDEAVPTTPDPADLVGAVLPTSQYPRILSDGFDEATRNAIRGASTDDVEKANGSSASRKTDTDSRVGRSETGNGSLDEVGGEARFLAALAAGDLPRCRWLWLDLMQTMSQKRLETLQPRYDAFIEDCARDLRDSFAESVRIGDFTTALSKGDEIVELFPESRMAADFQSLRSHLERRTTHPGSPTGVYQKF